MDRDLILVGGQFLDCTLPKEWQWIWHYFDTDLKKQYVAYYISFRSHLHFVEHTGFYCSRRWRKRLMKQFLALESAHNEARARGDIEGLAMIEMGQYKSWLKSKNSGP